MFTIVWKDLESRINSLEFTKFWGVSLFILFLVFVVVAPGYQRVINSFIPKLFIVMAISEFFVFLAFTTAVTMGNSLAGKEKTIRDLAIGSNFSIFSIVFGKLVAFFIHLLILLASVIPFNLLALNIGIDGDIMSFLSILIVVNLSLACWGYFISTLREKIFPIILFWISIIMLLVFTARLSYPLNLINPLTLIYYSQRSGLIYYLFVGLLGMALTFWRVVHLRRIAHEERSE
ncbi:MAG: hypothetical protein ACP5K2_02865 [bacterium]